MQPKDYRTYSLRLSNHMISVVDEARGRDTVDLVVGRTVFMRQAVYWYLKYLGYDPGRPGAGGRIGGDRERKAQGGGPSQESGSEFEDVPDQVG